MKNTTLTFLVLLFTAFNGMAQTARLQLIHNAPSPTVDIYVNGALFQNDVAFRQATPFVDVPANTPLTIGVALDTSTSAASAIANFNVQFEEGLTYVVTASGIVGDPDRPFTLIVNSGGREIAAAGKVDIAVLHGAPNAPAVDVDAVFVANELIDNLSYGQFTPYLSLDPGIYDLAVRANDNPAVVATYRADLSGLGGNAAYVFASGLLGGSPAFGIYAALANGTVVALPLTPTTKVQIIHNAPDPTVDVYAGNTRLLDNFAFRTATPFIDVPADRPIAIGVAPANSQSAGDAIATFNATFQTGKNYIATAQGLVGGTPAFGLNINDGARTFAAAGKVDIAVLHGAPNAPAVDVDAVFVANELIDNLAYGQFTPYLSLDPGIYDLAVRANDNPAVVATYRADLSGLGGNAAYVFASGLLGGSPAFGIYAALANGTVVALPLTPTTKVQIIHNAPDPTVDVYVGNTRLLDNFAFRTATPFIDVPADRPIAIGVAPANSQGAGDAIATFNATFQTGKNYIATAQGLVGGTPAFGLNINDGARTAAAAGKVDIAVLHGAPNAPAVDVDAVFVANELIDNLSYGQFTPYLSLDPGIYDLAVRANDNPAVVATYRADLSGLGGNAAYVFASGLLGGSPAFGIYAALANGTVVALPLTPTTKVQIIHNAPDPTVDVYAGNTRLLDNFAFRTATPFIDVPADRPLAIGVAPANSQSAGDAIATFNATFQTGKNYIVTAQGLVGGTPAFGLNINDGARTAAAAGKVDIAVLHGAPNAPAVDVDAVFVANELIDNLSYGQFTPYLSLDPGIYDLAVRANDNPAVVATYRADLSGLGGNAAYVFASGLLGGSPAFGIYAALANGTVVALPLTPTTKVQIIHNAPDPTVDVYAGNTRLLDNFAFRTATPFIDVPADRPLAIGVAPANSQSAGDAIATFNATFQTGKTYTVFAAGLVGATPAFNLYINENARIAANNASQVDIQVFHGSPDAPTVDVTVPGGGLIIDNLQYGTYQGYLGLPPLVYVLNITPGNNNNTIVATYRADLTGVTGQAITVFASGFLSGTAPAFGLWVALPNGTTFPLDQIVSSNELANRLTDLSLQPNPANEAVTLRFNLDAATDLRYRVIDVAGRTVLEGDFGTVNAGPFVETISTAAIENGMYQVEIRSSKGWIAKKLLIQR